MILVDSSVWIDYFRGTGTAQTDYLDAVLGHRSVAVGDLMLAEVLQGFDREREFRQARKLLLSFPVVNIVDEIVALKAAEHFRILRQRGITIRKTIDTLIATRCIRDRFTLLYSDRDFDPFVAQLGLIGAL